MLNFLPSDKLEALADSISDGSDSDSDDEEAEDEKPNLDASESKVDFSSSIDTIEEEIQIGSSSIVHVTPAPLISTGDNANASVSVNLEGINPDSLIMSETDLKDVSTSSIPSMSSLQEMFENIESKHDTIEESCQEVTHEVDVDVIENQGSLPMSSEQKNYSLFSDYNLDEIIRGKEREAVETNEGDNDEEDEDDLDNDPDYVDESSSDDEDAGNESNYDSLFELCDNYIDHLNSMMANLQTELSRNLQRQEQIEAEIADLQVTATSRAIYGANKHKIIARRPISIFAAPYFKDQNLFNPPPNEDTIKKSKNKELDVWIEFPKPFSEEERRALLNFVRRDAVRIKSLRLSQEKEMIEYKLNDFQFDQEVHEQLKEQLVICKKKLNDIENLPDEKMFVDRYEEYDWEKISVTDFRNAHSPKECKLQWQNQVHPSINRSKFTPEEDKLLKRLAEALHGQDWDAIAREMETGRTPHACFVRYMTRHNVVINNRKWEKSEDDRLRRLIAHCRINNMIPWTKVAFYMERRTKDQCYQRYVYSLKDIIKKGPFTDAEDMLLYIGDKLYNSKTKTDWAKIGEMLPCRTPIQLHCRFNHFMKCDFKPWTEDEDVALLELVRTHGLRDWVLIAEKLAGDRSRSQCRQRFQFIYKCFKKNPALALGNIDYKEDIGASKKKQIQIFDGLSKKFEEWKEAEMRAGTYQHDFDLMTDSELGEGFGNIELPNGERISRRSLTRFIRYIQEFLPKPDPPAPMPRLEKKSTRTLPAHEDALFKKPLSKRTMVDHHSPSNGSKAKKLKITGYDHQKFKRYRPKKVVRNRDKIGNSTFKTLIDRNIAKFFRPTWILRNNRLNAPSYKYTEKDLEMLTTAGTSVATILQVRPARWTEVSAGDVGAGGPRDKQSQLLQTFLRKQHHGIQADNISSPSAASSPKVRKTYGRTYSRKTVKQSDSRGATPTPMPTPVEEGGGGGRVSKGDTIDFVPPSVATLVGFRGVLLRNEYLADPTNHAQSYKQERDTVDQTVRAGAAADIGAGGEEAGAGGSAAHLAADQLLVRRFIQLFLWPAKMSGIPPTKQENLFLSDSDEET